MKVVLATGIYPPDIGGPATYAKALAEECSRKGMEVAVVTYGRKTEIRNQQSATNPKMQNAPAFAEASAGRKCIMHNEDWEVVRVSRFGGPFIRWWRYARALRKHAADADIVEAFSSVSVGVPLLLSGLRGVPPKTLLRLGGDFFWERYTARGGMKSLREWYASAGSRVFGLRFLMERLLRAFDTVVFSTRFQEELYERSYRRLPPHRVIENAFPANVPSVFAPHEPLRLLFVGRFVGFKNLEALVKAMDLLPNATLTLAGDGPTGWVLRSLAKRHGAPGAIAFREPHEGEEKLRLFAEHDLLVIPSVTEISPHTALEARALGLPVLLTAETGLSARLSRGIILRTLRTPGDIRAAVLEVRGNYAAFAREAAGDVPARGWRDVADEHLELFSRLLS